MMAERTGDRPDTLLLDDGDLALATDLYQLTMAAAFHARGAVRGALPRASYELYVRRLPVHRNFLVFAGLEQALASLERLRFDGEAIDYLRSLAPFADVDPGFFDTLAEFRFRGDVWAMPEGSVFFPGEPVLRVTGSILEAQIVETLLLSIVNFQSLIASKAARIRLAAGSRVALAEFGTRRGHGPAAGVWAARAAYIGGFDSTSNVLAGRRTGIPLVGTMAHSFVLAFESEEEAFRHYASVFPRHTVHLVDTYDVERGIDRAIAAGGGFAGIRLDSGDVGALAVEARRRLDRAGQTSAKIFASGDMHERRIAELLAGGAPIDAFGVGTRLVSSTDAPTVGGVYKLVAIEGNGGWVPKRKESPGKLAAAGRKQVYREYDGEGIVRDRVLPVEVDASPSAGTPLLERVVHHGELVSGSTLAEARARCRRDVAALPSRLRRLDTAAEPFPVEVDRRLETSIA